MNRSIFWLQSNILPSKDFAHKKWGLSMPRFFWRKQPPTLAADTFDPHKAQIEAPPGIQGRNYKYCVVEPENEVIRLCLAALYLFRLRTRVGCLCLIRVISSGIPVNKLAECHLSLLAVDQWSVSCRPDHPGLEGEVTSFWTTSF